MAEATNENGEVTTSSPSPTPIARSPRCSAAVPEETALACGDAEPRGEGRSNAGMRGPSESWPERSTSMTARLLRLAQHGLGDRDDVRGHAHAGARALAAPVAGAARQHAGLQRVHERVPARLDHVLVHADRAPGVRAVGGVEQHARDRRRRLGLVEDADLVVDELDVGEVRIGLGDRVAQRLVERVHGAVALGGAHEALALDPDLDRGLGHHPAVLALLGHHAPGLQAEQRHVARRSRCGSAGPASRRRPRTGSRGARAP